MSKTPTITLSLCFFVLAVSLSIEAQDKALSTPVSAPTESDNRVQDGLNGPVRRVRLETAKILLKEGKAVEGPRQLRGVATYDPRGRKIDTVAYPVEGDSLTGKEQYRYDEKGNIIEMVVRDVDGSVLNKETYKYEFDPLGNWQKMTTSIALYENGTVSYEPIEVSYRTIAYYYGAMEKLESGSSADAIPTTNRTATTSIIRLATGDSGVAESIGPTKAPVGTPVIDKQTVKESSSPVGTDRQNKQVANRPTSPSVAAITPAFPNIASAGNEKASFNHEAEEDPKSVAIKPLARSEKIPERVLSTASSGERNEINTTKPDATSSTTGMYQTGLKYMAAGAYDQAVDAFNQFIRQNPNDAIGYAKLGLAYSHLRKYREAIVELNTAIQIKPEALGVEAYYYLGYSYSALGYHKDAVEAFKTALYATRQEAVDNNQVSTSVPTGQIYYGLGLAHYNWKRYQEATKELSEAVKLNPKLAEAYYALGLAYLARGDRWSAQKQQRTLISVDAALAKKLADEISAASIRENTPCAGTGTGFCR
jgi:tetratricopeptide (TPR) repeat protein